MIKREETLKNSNNSKEAEVLASREGEGLVSQEEALDFLGVDLESIWEISWEEDSVVGDLEEEVSIKDIQEVIKVVKGGTKAVGDSAGSKEADMGSRADKGLPTASATEVKELMFNFDLTSRKMFNNA